MAYLTFDAASKEFHELLLANATMIEAALRLELPKLGVDKGDVVFRILDFHTSIASEAHVEIILKTDNPKVTAPEVVRILTGVLTMPFEVSRMPLGYGLNELLYEIRAYFRRERRNWASNYSNES